MAARFVRVASLARSGVSAGLCALTAGASTSWRLVVERWPVWLAFLLAGPLGVAAAEPGFNGADLSLIGVGLLFVYGVSR